MILHFTFVKYRDRGPKSIMDQMETDEQLKKEYMEYLQSW
jgi:hypothetical protein